MQSLNALIQTVAKLRDPDGGCPWDIEQTHQSLADCLIEESAELLQTIDRNDLPHMCEELGDVLLQVVMHAQMAAENKAFDFEAVARGINEKLIRRHPHVFGNTKELDKAGVLKQWEVIKAAEKPASTNAGKGLRDIPLTLPALLFARAVYKKLQKQGLMASLEHSTQASSQSLNEETAGRALFELVVRCRHDGIDPESALRRHARALIDTFAPVEHPTSKS